jgi:hypothetical protein
VALERIIFKSHTRAKITEYMDNLNLIDIPEGDAESDEGGRDADDFSPSGLLRYDISF